MDISHLIDLVGLWPAATILLAWWIDKIRREQITERDRHIATLETEARKATEAQAEEGAEWKRRYFEAEATNRVRS